MLENLASEPSTRGLRVVGTLLIAVLALLPFSSAPDSHTRCVPVTSSLDRPRFEQLYDRYDPPQLRRRTLGLNQHYLQRRPGSAAE